MDWIWAMKECKYFFEPGDQNLKMHRRFWCMLLVMFSIYMILKILHLSFQQPMLVQKAEKVQWAVKR